MQPHKFNKEELEKQKLQLEITELKKKWFKKPVHFFPLLTFIVAVSTIIWGFSSNLFDIKYQSLNLEKKNLEWDIKTFNKQKDSLLIQYKAIIDSITRLKFRLKESENSFIKNYRLQEARIIDSLSALNKSNEICNYYKKQLDSITAISIKKKAIVNALATENGQYLLTEDGKPILLE